jgi:hypothetical protein
VPIERAPNEPLDAFLCRILLALARQNGGELRISEENIEIDTRQLLVQDFDPKTNEIIFQVRSRYAQPIWVEPRQSQWTIPFEERARELGLDRVHRSAVPTDEDLAEKERLQRLKRTSRPVAPAPSA